jgi:plasmid stability protein
MLLSCYRHAMANIQVKGVPEEIHRRLRASAARRGQTIRDVVLEAVLRELSHEEFLSRLKQRSSVDLGRPAAELLREARAERETQL